ncbi:uncharacterized protein BKA55DRAFT_710644, partial [Fusarium redolens]
LSAVNRVLDEAKIERSQIKQVLLVSVSSRVPIIQQLLLSLFGGVILLRANNPDEVEVSGVSIATTMVREGQDNPSALYLLGKSSRQASGFSQQGASWRQYCVGKVKFLFAWAANYV